MDDPTVKWSEERFNECEEKLSPFLKVRARICYF
jgi:translation elongation factor EF-1alpha